MQERLGRFLSEYKKYLRDGPAHKLFEERLGEELGDLLWYLPNVATEFGLTLNGIAEANLKGQVQVEFQTAPDIAEVLTYLNGTLEGSGIQNRPSQLEGSANT